MARQQQVLLRSAPVNRRRERRRVGEIAGNATADCAAVCCCVPCAVMDMLVLAAYKVPAGLFKKAVRNKRKNRLQKRKDEALLEHKPSGPETGNVGPTLEEHLGLVKESPETIELEEEMWARFNGTGFWRSSSQRHQQHELELQTGELDR